MSRFVRLLVLFISLMGCEKDPEIPSSVTPNIQSTAAVTSITSTSAKSGGNLVSAGSGPILARGVCWGTSTNPTINGNKTTEPGGLGTYESIMTGLTSGITYYVRAYATNHAGTSYGNEIFFKTFSLPSLTTNLISSITSTSAVSGGNISSNGGSTVTARGVCWNTSPNPSIALPTKTSNGNGNGSYSSTITNLSAGVTYYIRAYATNLVGTSYGNELTFTTITQPTVSTSSISSLTTNSAVSGGNVTNSGGASVTVRGVCWSTSPNPTTALSTKTVNGTGTGNFASTISGLSSGVTYYVRAYATNSAGTSYGNEFTFTTLSLPTLSTDAISSITTNSAVSGGNITNSGGTSVTSRGVCWSTSPNPTTALTTKTVNGTGTGSFSSTLTGLSSGVTYYIRAYATNSVGTSYGLNVSFRTN